MATIIVKQNINLWFKDLLPFDKQKYHFLFKISSISREYVHVKFSLFTSLIFKYESEITQKSQFEKHICLENYILFLYHCDQKQAQLTNEDDEFIKECMKWIQFDKQREQFNSLREIPLYLYICMILLEKRLLLNRTFKVCKLQ